MWSTLYVSAILRRATMGCKQAPGGQAGNVNKWVTNASFKTDMLAYSIYKNVPCSHKGSYFLHFSWNLKPFWSKLYILTSIRSIGMENYFSIAKKSYCKLTNTGAEWWICRWPGKYRASLGDRSYSAPADAHQEKCSEFPDLISIRLHLSIFK